MKVYNILALEASGQPVGRQRAHNGAHPSLELASLIWMKQFPLDQI